MRKNNTIFVGMSTNTTNTYSIAKHIFDTLGLKEDTIVPVPPANLKIFRKHLSEMIRRQKSNNKYATRLAGDSVKVIRIQ
jgi:hypothetical protein